ncbi:MAG: TIGR04211 family SH3 domain-containing protein [Gammaproteobacteria bacterium]|nr:MAG: TIGR04211 family SH3 domain-containing protein [Gammaproteobacteria bacterium]
MKKLFILLTTLVVLSFSAFAEQQAFITDQLEVTMRTGQSSQHKIKRMLKSGKPVKVIEQNKETGYSKVRLNNGSVGWVLTRQLVYKPVASLQLKSTLNNLSIIKTENKKIKEELSLLKGEAGNTANENKTLSAETEKLSHELDSIRATAASAIQVAQEKELLQERVVNLEREMQTITRENQALQDSSAQDWFLIGGGVLFGGMLLGLLIPKISWRKKSSWDSF